MGSARISVTMSWTLAVPRMAKTASFFVVEREANKAYEGCSKPDCNWRNTVVQPCDGHVAMMSGVRIWCRV